MIASALEGIREALEDYFASLYGEAAPTVELSALMKQDGETDLETSEKQVIMTLLNVEEETYGTVRDYSNRPQHIKLTVMFSILNEIDYTEALHFLSSVIQYFQANATFNLDNLPILNDNIEKLEFSIKNLDFQNISGIWGTLGAKHMPSVIYSIKTITYTSTNLHVLQNI